MTLTLTKSKVTTLLDQLEDLTLLEGTQKGDPLDQLLTALYAAHAACIDRGDDNETTIVIVEG